MKRIFNILIISLFSGAIAISCSNSTLHTESSNPKKDPFDFTPPSEKKTETGLSKEAFRPSLDILFVVDESGSMGEYQDNLANNITLFTDSIVQTKFLDYHIGVITSSMGTFYPHCCGKLVGNPPYVDRNTPNGIFMLANNLLVGTSGDSSESFFDPVAAALSPANLAGVNKGFMRQDAPLAIIFITDADDQSSTLNSASKFWNYLLSLKGSADKIIIGAAYVLGNGVDSCTTSEDIVTTKRLPDFFKLSKAKAFSLCDPNYGVKLAEIGKLLANTEQTMFLKKYPQKTTIKVTMAGVELPNDAKTGWIYVPRNNSLKFGPDIDWDSYPDGAYPIVDFETVPIDLDHPN